MKSGQQILFSLYWSKGQWNRGTLSAGDLEYAKSAGYLFDFPNDRTHRETLNRLADVLSQIDARNVSDAFLFSLSTRRLEFRSALGSYYYAAAIPGHECINPVHCYLCGWYANEQPKNEYDNPYNAFNFERYKWGGVRHDQLDYALFDLEQFLRLPKVTPSDEDYRILNRIFQCVSLLEAREKAGALRKQISRQKILKSNAAELGTLLGILGICGILAAKGFPGYGELFADEYGRSPEENTNDFQYPLNHWRAGDGIDRQRCLEIFGTGIL